MPVLYLKNSQGELEPIPGMIGPPGPNEITTATATTLSGVLVGEDNYVREGEPGVDFAAGIHAEQHAAGGSDPITPADIGAAAAAAFAIHVNTLVTGEAGAHGLSQQMGEWTPILIGSSVNGSPTYTARNGKFYKLGNLCHISAQVEISNIGGMEGLILLRGSPYLPTSVIPEQYVGIGTFAGVKTGVQTSIFPRIDRFGNISFVAQTPTTAYVLDNTHIENNFRFFNLSIVFEI